MPGRDVHAGTRVVSGLYPSRNTTPLKLECRALLYALNKLCLYLCGAYFMVETNARTLFYQLNRVSSNIAGSLVTLWKAWIQLWNFDIRHVKGKKNVVANGLSWQYDDYKSKEFPLVQEFDIEEFY
jgi:hypothetical protein